MPGRFLYIKYDKYYNTWFVRCWRALKTFEMASLGNLEDTRIWHLVPCSASVLFQRQCLTNVTVDFASSILHGPGRGRIQIPNDGVLVKSSHLAVQCVEDEIGHG